ncbi:MAG: AbrB family transcriptional regulator [Hyphomicrobiaceae bacterium]
MAPDMADGGADIGVAVRNPVRTVEPFPLADLIPAPYGSFALALGFGAAGAVAFVHFGLPLPWFLGALTACLVASVAGLPVRRPSPLSIPMRATLGVAVGSAYTPALLDRLPSMLGSLALLIPFMGLVIVVGMAFYERVAKLDRPTAFYAAVPGGLTDMTTMAEDSGANVRAIILIQATRILVIVFALPLWLQWHDGLSVGQAFATRVRLAEVWPSDALVMVAMGWGGYKVARWLGMAGAPIVGPMLASGITHALGFSVAKVPLEVLVIAQISVGTMLGCQFRGLTFREFWGTMTWGIANAAALLVLTFGVATMVTRLTGFDPVSVLLAFAPGGQTELNLLAYVLGLDVAYVALHHLTRLAIVILGAQIVFRTRTDWRK